MAVVSVFELTWAPIEVFATVTGAQCVYLLAHNRVSGWVVGLASGAAFIIVFAQARLFGDVAIQVFYLAVSAQAIWIWRSPERSASKRPKRRVSWADHRLILGTIPVFMLAWLGIYAALTALGATLPFWTSLTTTMCLTAQLYLLGRYVQSWILYVAADVIYIPMFLSLGLTLTSGLYLVLMVLSTMGFVRFVREAAGAAADPVAALAQ
ncbi:nicotinamide riboside transporter PnuC [soil metagenome]